MTKKFDKTDIKVCAPFLRREREREFVLNYTTTIHFFHKTFFDFVVLMSVVIKQL